MHRYLRIRITFLFFFFLIEIFIHRYNLIKIATAKSENPDALPVVEHVAGDAFGVRIFGYVPSGFSRVELTDLTLPATTEELTIAAWFKTSAKVFDRDA